MLYIISTPIGNSLDVSLRTLDILKSCDMILCESFREATTFLKSHSLPKPSRLSELSEHTKPHEVDEYVDCCSKFKVVLMSDCGTPGFCDPGADLVRRCRQKSISVTALPGPSSFMAALSLSGLKNDQFIFRGFLPADSQTRDLEWNKLKKEDRAIWILDTPYRLQKILHEVEKFFPNRYCQLFCNLTTDGESQHRSLGKNLASIVPHEKAEFLLLIEPEKQ